MGEVLLEAGAMRECEEDGWMRDRSDPHGPRALPSRRSVGSAARRLSGAGGRCCLGCAGYDRRHLPGVPRRIRLDARISAPRTCPRLRRSAVP
jgi:hypothetical protein